MSVDYIGPESPAKRGRPALPEDERRMNIVTIRMTNSLKARMEAIAEAEGCSLSHAVELCLERHLAAHPSAPEGGKP